MAEENSQPMNNEVSSTPLSVRYKQFCKTPPLCVKKAMGWEEGKLLGLNVHTMMMFYFHITTTLRLMEYRREQYIAEGDRRESATQLTRDEREQSADKGNDLLMKLYSTNLRDYLREEGTLPMNEEKIEKLLSYNFEWWLRTKGMIEEVLWWEEK